MLTCKQATRLVSQGLDRRLGLAERLALQAHLLVCRGCASFLAQAPFLRHAIARLADR